MNPIEATLGNGERRAERMSLASCRTAPLSRAFFKVAAKIGSDTVANIASMATTTSSSAAEKPPQRRFWEICDA